MTAYLALAVVTGLMAFAGLTAADHDNLQDPLDWFAVQVLHGVCAVACAVVWPLVWACLLLGAVTCGIHAAATR
jgi:hypothetical protein